MKQTKIKWQRACPGLYVDSTNTWVISREDDRNWYSIRACLGWGLMLDGVTFFPDMGSVWHGDFWSLEEAKRAGEKMIAEGVEPRLEPCEKWQRSMNARHGN